MRKLSTLRVFAVASALSFASWLSSQTVVFSDDFSTAQNASYTTSGAIGASAWSITRNVADWGGRRNTSPAQLELTNDVGATANANGWVLASTSSSSFSSPYSTTLSSNPGLVTWTFNMRQIRPDPAGFGAGSYGVAYIIAGTTSTNNNTGTGYAVVLGQSGATDPIRLIHYNGGLQGTLTNLITSNTSGLADFGADYVSVQVNYTPSTNTWELFLRNDGVSSFADPVSGTLTSQGTVVNSTYTGTTLELMGGWWQGSTGATQSAFFDNVQVAVTTGGTNTSVQFASTGSTVNENVGTVNLTLEITDEDATNDTEVDVVLITGAPGRVNSYTTQTVTFPGGSGADETVTITVTDNSLCDGSTVIGFELQNITGGQGTPSSAPTIPTTSPSRTTMSAPA
jgi:hypothetical protein